MNTGKLERSALGDVSTCNFNIARTFWGADRIIPIIKTIENKNKIFRFIINILKICNKHKNVYIAEKI